MNSTAPPAVGLLFVRGSQPVGMSTGRTTAKIENPNPFSIGEGFGFLFSSENRTKVLFQPLCVQNLINKDVSQKSHMKYDERTCRFNMDTGCVELLTRWVMRI